MSVISMKQLLEAGVHFGHQTKKWNPKMRKYIFTDRNGIHIINLEDTAKQIDKAYLFIKEKVAQGASVLFVGTKKQASETIMQEAERAGMFYVNNRWLCGTLTNFSTIRTRIERMNKLNSINKKILLVGHSYNIRDKYLSEVIDLFKKFNVEIIYSDLFDDDYYFYLSKDLYWKYSKVNVSSVIYCKEQVDGIVFFTTFPCGLDSLVNELVMRKIDKPYLNLVIDDLDSLAGMETRIESFVDILEQN